MLFKKLELMLFERYNLKIDEDDWKNIEPELIDELESILNIKITSHKEILKGLEDLKKLYPNKFLRLEDYIKRLLRQKKDFLMKNQDKEKRKINKDEVEDKRRDGGGKFIDKKKKKKEIEYLYY
ncbi:MAG: hypothetical protein ACW981_03800 [Candidatus Hodarchaeales archaeon]|jgi:hypothetical protein